MDAPAFQDHYPDALAHCYGCGRLNPHGLQIKTGWEGDESVTRFRPRAEHTAIPGFVYGGLIASLIDCHGTGTAAAASVAPGAAYPRFVTASLHVDYLRPTPLGVELEVRGRVAERGPKRVVVLATVSANGVTTAKGQVVAVPMPERFGEAH